MSANTLVTGLHDFYLAMAALFSLSGTAVLFKLAASLARRGPRPSRLADFEIEDA